MPEKVSQAQRLRNATKIAVDLHTFVPVPQFPGHVRCKAGGKKRRACSEVIVESEDAVPGAGKNTGTVQDFLQNALEVQAVVDATARFTQASKAVAKCLYFQLQLFDLSH